MEKFKMIRSVTNTNFTEITGLRIKTTSLLNLFPIEIDDDGKYLLNIFRTYTVNEDIKNDLIYYQLFNLNESDWWENISFSFYDGVDLWWVNALMNDVINPFEEMSPGQNVKILKKQQIPRIVREIKYRSEEHV